MNDQLGDNPEALAGAAMMIQREHAKLREKAEAVEEKKGGSEIITGIVVVAVMIATLALMMFMNSGGS
ncbi:MAG: hypothetical protein AAGD43_13000 [Pseudomonadota bacterium]